MILQIRCPAIANPYEPSIRNFAEMLGEGLLPTNNNPLTETEKNIHAAFAKAARTRNYFMPQTEKTYCIETIQAAWARYVNHLDNAKELIASFEVQIVDSIFESLPENPAIYICTTALDNKIITV